MGGEVVPAPHKSTGTAMAGVRAGSGPAFAARRPWEMPLCPLCPRPGTRAPQGGCPGSCRDGGAGKSPPGSPPSCDSRDGAREGWSRPGEWGLPTAPSDKLKRWVWIFFFIYIYTYMYNFSLCLFIYQLA